MNKNMVVYGIGKWAEYLLTLARLNDIAYFIEEESYGEEAVWNGKMVYPVHYVAEERLEDIVIIISDSKRYMKCANRLNELGFVENLHYFNGWKLPAVFYDICNFDVPWEEDEKKADIFNNSAWMQRAEFMSKMIPADVKSIMDIGCGDEKLRRFISKDIKYYGVDYIKRNDDTIVRDLNQEKLTTLGFELYYLAVVFSDIYEKKSLIKQVCAGKYVLISLYPTDQFIRLDGHITNLASFSYQGISNDDVINEFFSNGFVLVNAQYNPSFQNAHYYLFQRIDDLQNK